MKHKRTKLFSCWAAVFVLAASLVFTACQNSSGGGSSGGGGNTSVTPKYKVTAAAGDHGKIAASPEIPAEGVAENTVITFTATADSGYLVDTWAITGGTKVSGGNEGDTTAQVKITAAATVNVTFKVKPPTQSFNITFSVDGGHGSLTAQLNGNPFAGGNVDQNKVITFTAAPDANFAVEKWTVNGTAVDGNTTNTYAHTVSAAAVIKVKFRYTGAALQVNNTAVSVEQGQSTTLKFVTAGSGNYKAEAEDKASYFWLETSLLNKQGKITVTGMAAGTDKRIKITDTVSGQVAYSGIITVTPLADYFEENNVRYHVIDKVNGYVEVTSDIGPKLGTEYKVESLTIPATVVHGSKTYTVTAINPNGMFGDILQEITVDNTNSYLSSENGVVFNKAKTMLLFYPRGKTDTGYTVPNTVKTLGDLTFNGVEELTTLTLNDGLQEIGWGSICYLANLEELTLPASVQTIAKDAISCLQQITSLTVPQGITKLPISFLSECPQLETVDIPSSVTEIMKYAFSECAMLDTVVCRAATPPNLGDNVFKDTAISNATLKVPAASIDAYKAAAVWQSFGSIKAIP